MLLTRAPVAGRQDRSLVPAAPRLACVKPVASVHPEPGSNSSLLLSCLFLLCKSFQARHLFLFMFCFHRHDHLCLFRSPSRQNSPPDLSVFRIDSSLLALVLLLFFLSIVILSMSSVGAFRIQPKNCAKLYRSFLLRKFPANF